MMGIKPSYATAALGLAFATPALADDDAARGRPMAAAFRYAGASQASGDYHADFERMRRDDLEQGRGKGRGKGGGHGPGGHGHGGHGHGGHGHGEHDDDCNTSPG